MKLFDKEDTDDRGQVGIGTLIIFIAMVLVAAVAAGVLINTAGLLESKASDTGSDAQAQVSNQIQVVTASGTVSGSSVENVSLVVKKSPGADTIDLEDATIHYVSDQNKTTLTYSASGPDAGNSTFGLSDIANDGDQVLDNSSERIQVDINLPASLGEGERATVRLVDQSGAQTVYGVNVPGTLSDENYVEV